MTLPIVHSLPRGTEPLAVFERLASLPHCIFFDSATPGGELGRYSFVAADPYAWHTGASDGSGGLDSLEQAMASVEKQAAVAELPPWQGGAAGIAGYEIGRGLERLPAARWNEFEIPALAFGMYDLVFAFDHRTGAAWIISQGLPATKIHARIARAQQRLDEAQTWLNDEPRSASAIPTALQTEDLAPQFPTDRNGVTSDFTRDDYLRAVMQAIEYIHAGDIFQVNLSQRLLWSQQQPSVDIYRDLRRRNAAPFAGYFDLGDTQVMSSSPERFISVRDCHVETRPIKGTRERSADPTRDAALAAELLAHPKDRAENVMIVDLLRNDLSRVCEAPSVRVPTLCGLESYKYVHHLVSVVEGKLRKDQSVVDLLRATLPGGSITGAPKVRAMEIIAELEPTARGPYCGSMFYAGLGGELDSSILIRTLVASRGWVQASVGGGIVADSNPQTEYEETWHKAGGLLP